MQKASAIPQPTADEVLTRTVRDNALALFMYDRDALEAVLRDDAARAAWFEQCERTEHGITMPSLTGQSRLQIPLAFLHEARKRILDERYAALNHPLDG